MWENQNSQTLSSSLRVLLQLYICVYWHALQILGCHTGSQTHMVTIKTVSLFGLWQPFPVAFSRQLPLSHPAALLPSTASHWDGFASLLIPHSATLWARQTVASKRDGVFFVHKVVKRSWKSWLWSFPIKKPSRFFIGVKLSSKCCSFCKHLKTLIVVWFSLVWFI